MCFQSVNLMITVNLEDIKAKIAESFNCLSLDANKVSPGAQAFPLMRCVVNSDGVLGALAHHIMHDLAVLECLNLLVFGRHQVAA